MIVLALILSALALLIACACAVLTLDVLKVNAQAWESLDRALADWADRRPPDP